MSLSSNISVSPVIGQSEFNTVEFPFLVTHNHNNNKGGMIQSRRYVNIQGKDAMIISSST